MSDNSKIIEKEEKRQFDKCLFDNDFFDVAPAEEEASDQENTEPEEEVITEEDLAQAESRGYTQGLAEGKEQAFEDYNNELKKHADKLALALANLDEARKDIELETTTRALTLLETISDLLLQDARENYPQALLKQALETAQTLSKEEQASVKIRTAAQTKDYLSENLLKEDAVKGLSAENIVVDSTLAPGDCIIEWTSGGLDLRLDQLADKIKQTLAGVAQTEKQNQSKDTSEPAKETPEPEAEDSEQKEAAAQAPQELGEKEATTEADTSDEDVANPEAEDETV